jgi:hypothetical protein
VFLQVLFFQHHVHEWIFNTFSINLHLVSLQLNFNLVVECNISPLSPLGIRVLLRNLLM